MYETKGDAVERFMKGLTRKSKVKRYQAYGDKIPTYLMDGYDVFVIDIYSCDRP